MPGDHDEWGFFPRVGGNGSLHELADHDDPTPRLHGLKSVSKAAVWAMAKKRPSSGRPAGFFSGRR